MSFYINKYNPWGGEENPNKNSDQEFDFDKFFYKANKNFSKFFRSHHNHKPEGQKMVIYVILGFLGLWLATGFFTVDSGEQAVITRFGKFNRIMDSGLHFKLPAPIESISLENVMKIRVEEIGYRSKKFASVSVEADYNPGLAASEAFMLTGDENIFDINFEVQWRISNLKDYMFNLVDVRNSVKSAAESAVREVVGSTPFTEAQTQGRDIVAQRAKSGLQKILDSYGAGVEIIGIQMKKMDAPAEVMDAFIDVQTAKADKNKEINMAQAYQNDVLPRARGEATKITQEAEAYRKEVTEKALGEASRFSAIYNKYKDAKDVTKSRIYLEYMEDILGKMDKMIMSSDKSLVPYLPVTELKKKDQ